MAKSIHYTFKINWFFLHFLGIFFTSRSFFSKLTRALFSKSTPVTKEEHLHCFTVHMLRIDPALELKTSGKGFGLQSRLLKFLIFWVSAMKIQNLRGLLSCPLGSNELSKAGSTLSIVKECECSSFVTWCSLWKLGSIQDLLTKYPRYKKSPIGIDEKINWF